MGQDALAALAASQEEVIPSAEEQEHAAAVARGDIIEEPKEDVLDPDILAELAGDDDDKATQPIVADDKKDDGSIPRPRFNEVIEENRRLKEQLDLLAKPAEVV